jgi:transcription factor E2F4/5
VVAAHSFTPYSHVFFAVFAPLLRLSPPPSEKDYYFNLDDNEGVCDLFDVPFISM